MSTAGCPTLIGHPALFFLHALCSSFSLSTLFFFTLILVFFFSPSFQSRAYNLVSNQENSSRSRRGDLIGPFDGFLQPWGLTLTIYALMSPPLDYENLGHNLGGLRFQHINELNYGPKNVGSFDM